MPMIEQALKHLKLLGSRESTQLAYCITALILIVIYGIKFFHINDFASIYGQPLTKLAPDRQWFQTGPINNFIGFILSPFFSWKISYFIIHAMNIGAIIIALRIWKNEQGDDSFKALLSILFITPVVVIPLMWWGKADAFLISSIIAIAALSGRSSKLIYCWAIIGILSHPQSFSIQLLGLALLGISRPLDTFKMIAVSYLVYSAYYFSIGSMDGRASFIIDNYQIILEAFLVAPIFTTFTFFGFFWFFLGSIARKISLPQISYLIIIFIITSITLDHTRVFALLSMPLICSIAISKSYVDEYFSYIKNLNIVVPYFVIALLHFQMWGVIVYDSFWVESFIFPLLAQKIITLANYFL